MAQATKLIALIDVGSNTIRMVVYRVNPADGTFESVINARDAVGLSSYVSNDGTMTAEGISVGCRSVGKFVHMCQLAQCNDVRIFATAAVRGCANSQEVVNAFSESARRPVRILSGEEEARLSMVGALTSVDLESGLFFDIGGGSTELAGLDGFGTAVYDSVPLGSLSSWRHRVLGGFPSSGELMDIEERFLERLRTSNVNARTYSDICAIGGTTRMALKVIKLIDEDRKAPNANVLTKDDLDTILNFANSNPSDLAWHVLSVKPDRISTFLPGCAIARAILRVSGCSSMQISGTGLREGFLVSECCEGGSLYELSQSLVKA